MSILSVVIPAYNEGKILLKTAGTLISLFEENRIDYQLIFVDDGSSDDTWENIEQAAALDPGVLGIHLSRNFGKEAAVFAGLGCARGDCSAVMDCDLQHPPEALLRMHELWKDGYEVIEGVKRSRGKESRFHTLSAFIFYRVMSRATGIDMTKASDFKLMDKKAVDALLEMPERNTFFRAMSSWVGFRTASVEFDVEERAEGRTKWSTRSLIKYAVENIISYSSLPMQFVTGAGIFSLFLSFVLGIQTLAKYCMGHAVEGFTTVILLILLLGSIVMISLGIIGLYIAQIYEEVKGRPRYIISKLVGSTGETPIDRHGQR